MYIACLVVVVLKVQLHRERKYLGLSQSRRTFGTRAQMALGKIPCHMAFASVRILFQFLCPTGVSMLWSICVPVHTTDCIQTVYELPLLSNNTAVKHFYASREQWEILTGYLWLVHPPGGDWANTWHRTNLILKEDAITAPVTSKLRSKAQNAHPQSALSATFPYAIRHAATAPCLYSEINQWLILTSDFSGESVDPWGWSLDRNISEQF